MHAHSMSEYRGSTKDLQRADQLQGLHSRISAVLLVQEIQGEFNQLSKVPQELHILYRS